MTTLIVPTDDRYAIWRHPIIRRLTDPVPLVAAGDYAAMEMLFIDMCDDPDEDEFYLEFGPYEEVKL